MSTIYHPMAKSISYRLNDGCLTPQGLESKITGSSGNENGTNDLSGASSNGVNSPASVNGTNPGSLKAINTAAAAAINSNTNSSSTILSPPLSPFQPDETVSSHSESVFANNSQPETKSYLSSKAPFKVENFNNYQLKVNPWNSFKHYRSNQFEFLKKYSVIQKKQSQDKLIKEKMVTKKRKYNTTNLDNSDSNSNSNSNGNNFNSDNKVRTRRIIKESNTEISDKIDSNNLPQTPKRRKVPTHKVSSPGGSRAGSPAGQNPHHLQQQQSLIDENIPDYSPSTSTLPNNNKCLKIDWKGQPMDLSNDPNIHKLHPAEIMLASILRLPCNVFLDSKRRFFYEKVNRLRSDMQFRRTDAQKACRIDVNKASRLFAAFEKVGWLKDHHFDKYL